MHSHDFLHNSQSVGNDAVGVALREAFAVANEELSITFFDQVAQVNVEVSRAAQKLGIEVGQGLAVYDHVAPVAAPRSE